MTYSIIILAAGKGSRFKSNEHKSLAAVQFAEGSLKRLIRQLKAIDVKHEIVIVTGHQSASIMSSLTQDFSNINFVHNINFSNGSLLDSICVGVKAVTKGQGAWVLFADTLYHKAALERLLQEPAETITLACLPIEANQVDSIGISFRS